MNPDFASILDDCWARLRAGESLQDCLDSYPDQAETLRPLLMLAADVEALPVPQTRPEAFQAGRQQMLSALTAKERSAKRVGPFSFWHLPRYVKWMRERGRSILALGEIPNARLALRSALSILVVVLLIGAPVALVVSADSLPGDTFYPVKRFREKIQLALTFDNQARQSLRERLAEERRQEVQSLIELGRSEIVKFEGRLQMISGGRWLVEGLWIQMTDETVVQGVPEIGLMVEIQARVQGDGTLVGVQVIVQMMPMVTDGVIPASTATATPIWTSTPLSTATATSTPTYVLTSTSTSTPSSAPSDLGPVDKPGSPPSTDLPRLTATVGPPAPTGLPYPTGTKPPPSLTPVLPTRTVTPIMPSPTFTGTLILPSPTTTGTLILPSPTPVITLTTPTPTTVLTPTITPQGSPTPTDSPIPTATPETSPTPVNSPTPVPSETPTGTPET